MKCRKNIRKLIVEYNNASPAQKPSTPLMQLKNAILALKTIPSRIVPAQVSRYDDYVYIHQQIMNHLNVEPGPHGAHKSPMFFPWHREFLRQFELDLQAVSGNPNLSLPYWNWTKDRIDGDVGFPFITDFLGGDGAANPNDRVTTGSFAQANGWQLNVDAEGLGFLRREFGQDGPGLPSAVNTRNALSTLTYDSAPWNTTVPSANSFRNRIEGWQGAGQIHNSVHRWVGGSMQPSTSPNDPVFFLHHNNIDRLWAVWMQKNPTVAHYLPLDATPIPAGVPPHHFVRLNEEMEDLTDYFGAPVRPSGLLNHKAIIWYDSDLPELTNETGLTLAFGDIPEDLTTFKAVKFRIKTCREVRFRITAPPTGNFGLANGQTVFIVQPDENADFVSGYVFVQFHSVGAASQNSAFTIQPYIIDEEGYYAATEGGEFNIGSPITLTVTATKIPRENNAIALVLDRSGSMSASAGGTSTRSTLLKNAVSVFHTLMLPNDEICIVSFDDLTETLLPVTLQSAGLGSTLTGTGLDPRGSTGIGAGIQAGATLLNTAAHTNKAMLVLTDGNENVHPYVSELPAEMLNNKTYAIGFGLHGEVSEVVLNQITQNTQGDLIITGNISTTEQQFNLTKYFVQVLAGISNNNVILDPQGNLFQGSEHRIPFDVAETDISIDVITLCPLPLMLDFSLETPSGSIIEALTVGIEPNVGFTMGKEVCFYRLMLPALTSNASGSHKGKWTAILKLKSEKEIGALLQNEKMDSKLMQAFLKNSLPYSLLVHTYSNLYLQASAQQVSFLPNNKVQLSTTINEYGIPFNGQASVWAEITKPNQNTFSLPFHKEENGAWASYFNMDINGIYAIKIFTEGITSGGSRFTREKSLTAASFLGDNNPPSSNPELTRYYSNLSRLALLSLFVLVLILLMIWYCCVKHRG